MTLSVPEPEPVRCVDQDTLAAADPEDIASRAGVDADVVTDVLQALAEFECERDPSQDPRVLARLYYQEGLTQAEIADEVGCSQMCISNRMREYDIAPGLGGRRVWDTVYGNGGESA